MMYEDIEDKLAEGHSNAVRLNRCAVAVTIGGVVESIPLVAGCIAGNYIGERMDLEFTQLEAVIITSFVEEEVRSLMKGLLEV